MHGFLFFHNACSHVDDLIMVKENTIKDAVKFMIKDEKYIAEGSGAAPVAAVLSASERVGGKNIALVISGGNIDGDLMIRLLNR